MMTTSSLLALALGLAAGDTELVSLTVTGFGAGSDSLGARVSQHGRYVAFQSAAAKLVAGDTNGVADVFVRDRDTGETTRVSVDSAGAQGNGPSFDPDVSANGRFVVFTSSASNLVAGDTNGVDDVFLRDRDTGETTRLSVGPLGGEAGLPSLDPRISADGTAVVFTSTDKLVGGPIPGMMNVYHRDLASGAITLVSALPSGVSGDHGGHHPHLSADGRVVVFDSASTDLVAGDANGAFDVFLRDLDAGTTQLVSRASDGTAGDGDSVRPAISADGRFVAYESRSTTFAAGDTDTSDVFRTDRFTGETILASVGSGGAFGDGWSFAPSISAGGRRVAFHSEATNLVVGDGNAVLDVFVRDLHDKATTRASVDTLGFEANGDSERAGLSANGAFVVFTSAADNLDPADGDTGLDVFAHEIGAIESAPRRAPIASSQSFVAFAPGRVGAAGRTSGGSYVAHLSVGLASAAKTASSTSFVVHGGTGAMTRQLTSGAAPMVFGASPYTTGTGGGHAVAVHGFNLDGGGGESASLVGSPLTGLSSVSNTLLSGQTGAGVNPFGNPVGRGTIAVTTSRGTDAAADAFVFGPALSADAEPRIGAPFELDVHGAAGGFFQVAIGLSLPGFAAPVWPLAGAAEIVVGVSSVTGLQAAAASPETVSLPIPAQPTLIGQAVELQAIALTGLAPLAGSFTNRLKVTVAP